MEPMEYPGGTERASESPLVRNFLKWFLRRESLVHSGGIGRLLDTFDKGMVEDRVWWEDEVRAGLLRSALPTLGGLLERPLLLTEIMFLCERVDEYIQLYGMGLGAWL